MIKLKKTFKKYNEEEYLKFDRIENPPSKRPDLCAFLLLDALVPATRDLIDWAGYDEISLDVDLDKLKQVATEEDILFLVRCGIRYDDEGCLKMFV